MTRQGILPSMPPRYKVRRLRLHSQHQVIVVMRADCDVCRSEGLAIRSQVLVTHGERHIHAILFQVEGETMLALDEIGLSEAAWGLLGVTEGDEVAVAHPPALESLADVRHRIYGNRLNTPALSAIVRDVVDGRYSDVHLSSFLTATASFPLDEEETVSLTRAMVDVGERLHWDVPIVMDKHCIGGLPGNRTTPIIVAIVAANNLMMPKTSSRAITSPAGTADTMETLAPVDLDIPTMKRVVEVEGGCIAWGGAVRLSPADDIFIRVGRELDIDTEGQLIASVLSKKISAGATHVIIDIPVGATAKVRSMEAADRLADRMIAVAAKFGLAVSCVRTDGSQPVGRGIGPALEAYDVLAVLQNAADAPDDLRQRAAMLAGAALEIGGVARREEGMKLALATLADGRAWSKFKAICKAQGGLRTLPKASHLYRLVASNAGRVIHINNRKLARLAKLAGAPDVKEAGILMKVRLGEDVDRGQPLMEVHAASAAELAYALDYAARAGDLILVES